MESQLGFALKREDDPFYAVPRDEAAADAYFSERMARYQRWTAQAAPLVQRLMAADPESIDINFLYQDLFHGGKEQGMAEYAMLQMMADINHALREHKTGPDQVRAIVGPTDVRDAMVLRVNLYARDGGAVLATSDKPLELAADLQAEVDDICDVLATIGIDGVAVAMKFDRDGKPVDPRPTIRKTENLPLTGLRHFVRCEVPSADCTAAHAATDFLLSVLPANF